MINEVSINLSGYTLQQDRATHITAAVAATASTIAAPITLSLASTDSVGKGVVEIDKGNAYQVFRQASQRDQIAGLSIVVGVLN